MAKKHYNPKYHGLTLELLGLIVQANHIKTIRELKDDRVRVAFINKNYGMDNANDFPWMVVDDAIEYINKLEF